MIFSKKKKNALILEQDCHTTLTLFHQNFPMEIRSKIIRYYDVEPTARGLYRTASACHWRGRQARITRTYAQAEVCLSSRRLCVLQGRQYRSTCPSEVLLTSRLAINNSTSAKISGRTYFVDNSVCGAFRC